MDLFLKLAVSLSIGLLIGLERGWQERAAPEGSRIAGLRTFGLIGFLGGLWAVLAEQLGALVLGLAFAVLAVLMILAHREDVRRNRDLGITTVVAALVTFTLGALAVLGQVAVAAAGAVLTTTLLSLKPVLHRWLLRLEFQDLTAVIKLLLISVVVLPALPDKGYGPWQALNPYRIWWMVILIAALSFAGYVAIKWAGTRRGVLLTGLLGGLVSSTLTTLTFSRLAREHHTDGVLAAGIVLASAVMLPRMLATVAVINAALLPMLAAPLGLMACAASLGAWWLGRQRDKDPPESKLELGNPMKLLPALKFGVLLALVMLLANGMHAWLGHEGLYVAAAISGITDVDAITLSLAQMAQETIAGAPAVRGIVIAALVNTAAKGALAAAIAGRDMARRVLPVFGLTLAAGALGLYLTELLALPA
ncbi:MAG: MgtC/SapB family protein [Gammaproteobacteria bacterium]|nr:MgtC/SapB family protein [Gammaproteobacteria bacterium]